MQTDWLPYLLTGCFAGYSAGLLGIGGGLIIVPVLFYLFTQQGFDNQHTMHMALATSLASIVFTSLSSTWAHHKKGAVRWPLVAMLTPGIISGSVAGASFASSLDTVWLKPFFGIFECLVAWHMLRPLTVQPQRNITSVTALLSGSVIGFISSLVGIGGGTLTVPLLHWLKTDMREAIATSAACGLPIALFASLAYAYHGQAHTFIDSNQSMNFFHFGYIHIPALLLIVSASVLTAPAGATTAHKLPAKHLKQLFATILLLLGLKMLIT